MVCYPLNAATQRGASPNSFKWFGSSPRVANSFTMSVYLKIFVIACDRRFPCLSPFATILFPKYGLYWRMEYKLVLSRTFCAARLKKKSQIWSKVFQKTDGWCLLHLYIYIIMVNNKTHRCRAKPAIPKTSDDAHFLPPTDSDPELEAKVDLFGDESQEYFLKTQKRFVKCKVAVIRVV